MAIGFCGHEVSARALELIEGVVGSCAGLTRTELAHTVCELLGWWRANGRLKARECWSLLEQLETDGALELPQRRQTKPKGARTRVPRTARVTTREQRELWRELVGRYHDQGHAVPYGAQLRNLASAVLALAARTLVADWQRAYAVRPLLLETLVDSARFAGTCYRAANWVAVGSTTGRGRMDRHREREGHAPKAVFVYPLVRDARARLRAEGRAERQGAVAGAVVA